MFYVVKCKLRAKKHQADYFDKNIGCCRFIYNNTLQYCIEHHQKNSALPKEKQEKRPGAYDLQNRIPALKKDYPWLTEVDSQALKYAAAQVDLAFKNFFRRIKQGISPGFPRFKSKYKSRASFTLTQGQYIRYDDRSIKLPKIGSVRIDNTNFNPPDNDVLVKRATISRTPSGNYYISLLFEDDLPDPEVIHKPDPDMITLDLGLKKMFRAKGNSGPSWDIHSPRFFRDEMKKLAKEQKKLARKKIRSNRWLKQKIRVAKVHERIANIRRYFFYILTNDLIRSSQAIVAEDLDIKGMIQDTVNKESGKKRRNINRAFYDQALSEFIRIIKYKSERAGKPFYLVDTLRAPNKLCSQCNTINDHVTLDTLHWQCSHCETKHNRSENCLVNLERMAGEMALEMSKSSVDI